MTPLTAHSIISFLLSFLPVVVFLIALVLIDSYKLVALRHVLNAILVGCIVLFVCLWINTFLMNGLKIDTETYARYVAPFTEELFKGAFVVYLIWRKRIGFMVDASIYGFAIGAGFAIVENVFYFKILSDPDLLLWIIRGFGTAIMHGGVTAIMGIVSMYYSSRFAANRFFVYLPGLLLAVVVHSVFNHFVLPPQLSPVVLLVVLSVLIAAVFRASEKGTRVWLGVRFDTDAELLEIINTGKTSESRVGEYLRSLQSRFPGQVVADMLCMLRLHLELSIRAKGILLMRETGFKIPQEPEIEERLRELKYLEKNVGHTGLRAISPILNMSDKDLWQLYMLGRR